MIITTTPSIEGKTIVEYKGIVTGEAILGANIFKDFLASIRDIVGGRSGAYESAIREAKDIALRELEQQTRMMGGNAIVGVDLDYETINQMLMVTASGTAVVVQ